MSDAEPHGKRAEFVRGEKCLEAVVLRPGEQRTDPAREQLGQKRVLVLGSRGAVLLDLVRDARQLLDELAFDEGFEQILAAAVMQRLLRVGKVSVGGQNDNGRHRNGVVVQAL